MDILKNVRLFTGGLDLTTANNQVELNPEAEEKDVTTFGDYDPDTQSVWKAVQAGIKSAKPTGKGFWPADDPNRVDAELWSALGGVGAWTVGPNGATAGDLAWVTNTLTGQYQLLGAVGDIAPWSASWPTSWPLARGRFLHGPGTVRTASGDGTAVELGPVPAGRELIAALHVLGVAGTSSPSITVAVESDADDDFASETTRITFGAATAPGGQARRLTGPFTDTWYRATWTVTGTGPSFLFVVSLGLA